MKIKISKDGILPEGEYELTNKEKLHNAQSNLKFNGTERQTQTVPKIEIRKKIKFYPRGYTNSELGDLIDKYGDLNVDKFNKDRASDEAQKQIDEDMKAGQAIGIQGTPGFVLNGVKILGAYPIDHFEKIISKLETTAKK